jgi:hypothetical protein
MWQDDFASDEHQVIYADAGPISATSIAAYAQLGAYFSRLVKKEPYLLAFLNSTPAARRVGTIVEDEGDHHFSRFDSGAHDDKVLPCYICLQRFTLERSFGHNSRLETDTGVCAQLLFRGSALAFCVRGRGVGGCALAGRRRLRCARVGPFIIVDTK